MFNLVFNALVSVEVGKRVIIKDIKLHCMKYGIYCFIFNIKQIVVKMCLKWKLDIDTIKKPAIKDLHSPKIIY